MGFVFPWAAIEATWKERDPGRARVPELSDLIDARDGALAAFNDPANKAVVQFAGVFGSIIPKRRDHTRRSDLDTFLLYREGMKDKALVLMRDIRETAKKSHGVAVNGRVIPVAAARRGEHPFGPSYRTMWENLASQDPPMLVGDPDRLSATLKMTPGRTVRQEMQSRILRYKRRMRRHQRDFKRIRDAQGMDRELEKQWGRCVRPLHMYLNLARKLLWWQHGELPDDGKKAVFREFRREKAFEKLRDPFEALIAIDREYDELLERALERKVDKEAYQAAVFDIIKRVFRENVRLLDLAVSHVSRAPEHAKEGGNGHASPPAPPPRDRLSARKRRERAKAAMR